MALSVAGRAGLAVAALSATFSLAVVTGSLNECPTCHTRSDETTVIVSSRAISRHEALDTLAEQGALHVAWIPVESAIPDRVTSLDQLQGECARRDIPADQQINSQWLGKCD